MSSNSDTETFTPMLTARAEGSESQDSGNESDSSIYLSIGFRPRGRPAKPVATSGKGGGGDKRDDKKKDGKKQDDKEKDKKVEKRKKDSPK